ncbi:hypothetical protein BHM03_00042007, partial [Ensete ventricosum]
VLGGSNPSSRNDEGPEDLSSSPHSFCHLQSHPNIHIVSWWSSNPPIDADWSKEPIPRRCCRCMCLYCSLRVVHARSTAPKPITIVVIYHLQSICTGGRVGVGVGVGVGLAFPVYASILTSWHPLLSWIGSLPQRGGVRDLHGTLNRTLLTFWISASSSQIITPADVHGDRYKGMNCLLFTVITGCRLRKWLDDMTVHLRSSKHNQTTVFDFSEGVRELLQLMCPTTRSRPPCTLFEATTLVIFLERSQIFLHVSQEKQCHIFLTTV